MIDVETIEKLPEAVVWKPAALMRDYTTFRLGGPCVGVVECPSAEALQETVRVLAEAQIPFLTIGQGSNLLVSDEGIERVILRYCAEEAPELEMVGEGVRVPANMLVDDLARLTIEAGVGDVSFCSGIPGTVGGAIVGNAGAFGKQLGDVVCAVELLDLQGEIHRVEHEELAFAYRSSTLKHSGEIVLSAELRLVPMEQEVLQVERARIMDLRRAKHPDWRVSPCAGSVFRNVEPSSAAERRQAAGWFLEQAGAMEMRVGQAHLFEKHANIIIAEPGATARDVFQLSELMKGAVQERFGFELTREILVLGALS